MFFKKDNGSTQSIVTVGYTTYTGDVTGAGAGTVALTLANVASLPSTLPTDYGIVKVNAKGQVTDVVLLDKTRIETLLGYTPARLDAPLFTTDTATNLIFPRSVTPDVGDSSVNIATTEFVYKSINGALSVDMTAGDVTLTSAQASNSVFIVTGTPAAGANLIFPAAAKGIIRIRNAATNSINVKTSAGTVTAVAGGGTSRDFYCDGTNIVLADTLTSAMVTAALGFTPESTLNKGVANGYASLGADGKVPTAQLPSSVAGGMSYNGTWNPATNTPTLTSGTGTQGHYYTCSVDGTTTIDGVSTWYAGDHIAFNGTTWEKFEGSATQVSTFNGRNGVVTLTDTDVNTALGYTAARLDAPVFTKDTATGLIYPQTVTPPTTDNTTAIASTAFVNSYVNANAVASILSAADGTTTLKGANVKINYSDVWGTLDGGTY